ncbi:MAG: phasin family protein [Rhodomicrobium sp.]
MVENPFEIPQQMRDLAEQNIKQAHAAYEQLTDFVTKAISAWMGAMPASPVATGFKDFQDRAAEIAKKNADSAFALVEKIVKAQTFQEILTLQTQFAQDRMQAFTTQTQQLFGLMGEAFEKSERGAMGAGMSATPSNLLVTAFKDVQDRAVAMAKTNADSAFALIEKIAKAQNIQELLTHQTQFAQEQMQAFATQTQELQRLIGEALQKSATLRSFGMN